MDTREKTLIKKYGFNKASYKYVPAGGELLRFIGQVVIRVAFSKDSGSWEVTGTDRVFIKSIDAYDPATMTYRCTWMNIKNPEKENETRIIPEGFSFSEKGPDEEGKMERFIPYSTHCRLVEDEAFYSRLKSLWGKRDTLGKDQLELISSSKDQAAILKYSNNVGALIKLSDSEFLWARIVELNLNHKAGIDYKVRIVTEEKDTWTFMIKSTDTSYDFENGLGEMKIIDLRSIEGEE